MNVSVGIPTIGRVETLPMVLMSLKDQYSVNEVIILDESKVPVCENYVVNQALDLLSLSYIDVKIIRSRIRSGIGSARVQLASEARNNILIMVDDDVVLEPKCIEILIDGINDGYSWSVPSCILVSAGLEVDGYTDRLVDPSDVEVKKWVERYPWFYPYFRFSTSVQKSIPCAGTQCIAIRKNMVIKFANELLSLRGLPREDTVLTKLAGPGFFDSNALCYHFEHPSQVTRGEWGSKMFYRIHEAIMENPSGFVSLIGYKK